MTARFINTDLHLESHFDLRPLVAELESKKLTPLGVCAQVDGVWSIAIETSHVKPTVRSSALRLLTVIENLDSKSRLAWDRCHVREFDFGYERRSQARESVALIDNDLVQRIAAVGAAIKVTIYR